MCFFCLEPGAENGSSVTCSKCSMSFDTKMLLNIHVRRYCKMNVFHCTKCKRKFNWRSALYKHTKKHCKDAVNNDVLEDTKEANIECVKYVNIEDIKNESLDIHNEILEYMKEQTVEDIKDDLEYMNEQTVEDIKDDNVENTREEKFKCSTCLKTFKDEATLESHIYIECSLNPYKCSLCALKFESKISLFKHKLSHKKDEKEIGGQKKDEKDALGDKKDAVGDKNDVLGDKKDAVGDKTDALGDKKDAVGDKTDAICDKKDELEVSGPKHVEEKTKENEPTITCPLCLKSFEKQEHFNNHTSSCGKKYYQCNACANMYDSRKEYVKHVGGCQPENKDNNVSVTCPMCFTAFKKNVFLETHIYRVCSPGFHCLKCNTKFETKSILDEHVLNHCKGEPDAKEGVFECVNCLRSYSTKEILMSHLQFPCHGPASFSCVFCSYKTKMKWSLRFHLQTTHSNRQRSERRGQSQNFDPGSDPNTS